MSNCSINQDLRHVSRQFIKTRRYGIISGAILKGQEKGHYFDIDEIASLVEKEVDRININNEKKGAVTVPFSKDFLKTSLLDRINNEKVFSQVDFFNKELVDLYAEGSDPMVYMLSVFEQDLMRAVFVDPKAKEDKITLDDSILNAKINNYKNDLFSVVFNEVVESEQFKEKYTDVEYIPLFTEGRYNRDSNYTEILKDFGTLYKNYSLAVNIFEAKDLVRLDKYNAAVILTNFDKLMEDRFTNLIKVNQFNVGVLTNPPISFQYIREFKGIAKTSWKDTHEKQSAERYAGKILDMFSRIMPLLDIDGNILKNRYLGKKRLALVGSLLKKHGNDAFKKAFSKDPKGNLKKYLKHLVDRNELENHASVISLYKYLYDVREGIVAIIDAAKEDNKSLAASIVDPEVVIAHYINNIINPTYGIYEAREDKVFLNLVDRETKSDELLDAIIKHIESVSKSYDGIDISTLDVNNQEHRKIIKDLTSVDFTKSLKKLIGRTELGDPQESSRVLLLKAKDLLSNLTASREDKRKLFANKYMGSLLTGMLAELNPEAVMTFKKTNGDNIPTVAQSNIAYEKKASLEIAEDSYQNKEGVLLLENPGLIQNTETLLEVKTYRGEAKDAVALNPTENFFLNFVENYVKAIKTGEKMSVKLVNFSDKKTIHNDLVDLDHNIIFKGKAFGSLRNMSLSTLKKLNNNLLNTYYKRLTTHIINDYATLTHPTNKKNLIAKGKDIAETINNINEFFTKYSAKNKKGGKIKYDFRDIINHNVLIVQKAIEAGDRTVKPLEFVDEVHYSKYTDGIQFNKNILGYLERTNSDTFNNGAETKFLKELITIEADISGADLLDTSTKSFGKIEEFFESINLKQGE